MDWQSFFFAPLEGFQLAEALDFAPKILDTTLREGVQCQGVSFGIPESCEIAAALVGLGVDIIECGHPSISAFEIDRINETIKACDDTPVLVHARANKSDIDAARTTDAAWIGIFLGINEVSRRARVKSISKKLPAVIFDSVSYAKSLGFKVRFTVEDSSRTKLPELLEAFSIAISAGADSIGFADTVGKLCPWEVDRSIRAISEKFPSTAIQGHFHNDRGLAEANALMAIRAGARSISSSLNGIGERSGITDTIVLLANLANLKWRDSPKSNLLPYASKLVEAHSRHSISRSHPVVGENAFTHVAKLHRSASDVDETTYAWASPSTFGREANQQPASLPSGLGDLVIDSPEVIHATELRYHRKGPGDRYLMLDNRVVSDARKYCIVRKIPPLKDYGNGHVDKHRHWVDSLFLFLGDESDLTGLFVEVTIGSLTRKISSPAAVFIPSGVEHSYRVVGGSGVFINYVLAGEYNSSLLDKKKAVSPASYNGEAT